MASRSIGSYSRRRYRTAAASTPSSSEPSVTRVAPHSTITATAVLATSRDPVTYRAISRSASPLMRSCRWFRTRKSASLKGSRRNARTGRMPFIVSTNFTITAAIAVERARNTCPARRW